MVQHIFVYGSLLFSEIFGKVIFNVDEKSMQMLTFFEGEQYRKTTANITLQNKRIEVVLYEWQDDYSFLGEADWDFENFRKNSLDFYICEVIPLTLKEFETYYESE